MLTFRVVPGPVKQHERLQNGGKIRDERRPVPLSYPSLEPGTKCQRRARGHRENLNLRSAQDPRHSLDHFRHFRQSFAAQHGDQLNRVVHGDVPQSLVSQLGGKRKAAH